MRSDKRYSRIPSLRGQRDSAHQEQERSVSPAVLSGLAPSEEEGDSLALKSTASTCNLI